jgi:AAA domain
MKIAISGTHSTGKSTALQSARDYLLNRGLDVAIVSDLAIKCPLPILRQHTPQSALWIAAQGVCSEIASASRSKIVLVDRPVIDAWGYMRAGAKLGHSAPRERRSAAE